MVYVTCIVSMREPTTEKPMPNTRGCHDPLRSDPRFVDLLHRMNLQP